VASAEKIANPSVAADLLGGVEDRGDEARPVGLGAGVCRGGDAGEHGSDPEREQDQPGEDVREVAAVHRHLVPMGRSLMLGYPM
jgi:hypothetical protein